MKTDSVQLPGRDHQADLRQYRAISPLAPIALVLGVSSALALAHPTLWFTPVLAIGVAVAALRSIAREREAIGGRKVAVLGLALAVFFGACAPTRLICQRFLITRQARQFATHWLQLVRSGKAYEAHQWTQSQSYRVGPDTDLREFYESDDFAKEQLSEFLSKEPVRTLIQGGQSGQLRYLQTAETRGSLKEGLTVLQFEVTDGENMPDPLQFRIGVKRKVLPRGKIPEWRITDASSPEELGTELH